MKHGLNIVLLIFLVLCSCKKKPSKEKNRYYYYYDGEIIVKRNGKNWKPKLIALSNHKDSFWLTIDDYRDGFTWDRFSIGNMLLQEGNYFLVSRKVWDTTTNLIIKKMVPTDYNGSFNQGSDVYTLNYLRTDRLAFITVSSYDSVRKTVSGTFSLSFMRDSAYSKMGIYLDTVNYTEGFFSATIHHPDELPQ